MIKTETKVRGRAAKISDLVLNFVILYKAISYFDEEGNFDLSKVALKHDEFTKPCKSLPHCLSPSENPCISWERKNFECIVCSEPLTNATGEG